MQLYKPLINTVVFQSSIKLDLYFSLFYHLCRQDTNPLLYTSVFYNRLDDAGVEVLWPLTTALSATLLYYLCII